MRNLAQIPKEKIRNSTFWRRKNCPGRVINANSWFNIQGGKFKDVIENERKIKGEIMRCKKIRLNPSQTQRQILKTWLEICRQVYNLTVKYFKNRKIVSKYNARTIMRKKIDNQPYLSALIKSSKIPLHTLNNAIFDVIKAYKTAMANLRAKNINHFRLRYKKASKNTHILVLEPNVFNLAGTGLKARILKNLNPSAVLNTLSDVRLQYNIQTKEFIAYIPEIRKIDYTLKRMNRCALDPGMRAFQTAYSDDGAHYQFSTQTGKKIKDLTRKIENVNLYKQSKWHKKYTTRLRTRIKNMTADLHWKTARFLCKRFDNIMIGNMSTKSIIKKHASVLSPETKRFCTSLAHYTFRERLRVKCEEFAVNFACVDESYTSKTCGGCGELNNNLGANETFKCPLCLYSMPRDIHGARNILIKHT